MSIHTYNTEIEYFNITHEVAITFTYTPGEPERGPAYSSGGEPEVGPEVEIQRVRVQVDGAWRMVHPIPLEWEQEIEEKLIEFVESEDH